MSACAISRRSLDTTPRAASLTASVRFLLDGLGVQRRQEVGHNDEVSCPANDAACQARIQGFGTVAWRHEVRT